MAVGAMLKFATHVHVAGIELDTVGVILMIVGAFGLLLVPFLCVRDNDASPSRHRCSDGRGLASRLRPPGVAAPRGRGRRRGACSAPCRVCRQSRRILRDGVAPPNRVSIAMELQADCLAGVWAHSTYDRGLLERGDLDEALRAVGDDRIRSRSRGA